MAEKPSTLIARCTCGTKFRVPVKLAGKKAKCRRCGGVVKIPAADGASTLGAPRRRPTSARRQVVSGTAPVSGAAAKSSPNAPAKPATDKLHFRCPCGARIGMPISAAGRKVRCPKCSATIRVPTPAGAPQTKPKPKPKPKPAEPVMAPAADESALDDLLALAEGDHVESLDPQPIEDDDLYKFSEQSFIKPEEPRGSYSSVLLAKKETGPALTCPGCHTQLPPGVKLCMACGIDAKTGRAPLIVEEEDLDDAYITAERMIWWFSWLIPLSVFPIASEAFGTRVPWTVRGVALTCILFSLWGFSAITCISKPSPSAQNLMLWPNELGEVKPVSDSSLPVSAAALPAVDAEPNRPTESLDPNDPNYVDAFFAMGQNPDDPNDPNYFMSEAHWNAYAAFRTADLQRQGIGFHWYQLLTHQFLHAGFFHLFGNLLFLFILGSRVNALIGNYLTLVIYPVLGIIAALVHLEMSNDLFTTPMLGASGAIMGMAGLYLVLFPAHKVHTAFWFRAGFMGLLMMPFLLILLFMFIPALLLVAAPVLIAIVWLGVVFIFKLFLGITPIRGFWFVLGWIAFDAFYVYFNIEDGTAHWAHLGGFTGGVVIGLGLLTGRLINARGGDILSFLFGTKAWPLIGKPTARRLSLP